MIAGLFKTPFDIYGLFGFNRLHSWRNHCAVSGFIKSKWLIIYLRSRAQTLLLQRLTTI